MRSSRLDHFIILFCQFFSTFGLMVLIPIMPLYMEKLTAHMSAPTIWAGLALAAPAIGSLFTAPIVGHLSDTFGHKKSLVTFSGRFLYFNTAHGERPAFIPVYFRANFTRFLRSFCDLKCLCFISF